ncbi:MAG TPA: RHS repeat-associated core domain-containing protein, partial [Gammaproteobacteria bacterium]|nr:RHS repeat-associated core domain-containing protein [Gammaproteobacteria bacterium]
ETGLYYNRHRYYDADVGQFISQDPIGLAGGINNYQYGLNTAGWVDPLGLSCKFYRYVGEGEAEVIRRTGKIPNVDAAGNLKDVYITNRLYKTAGRAKTHNQLPSKPLYRIEIDPANVPSRTPFTKVNPDDNPKWGIGGGIEATTKDAIPVDPAMLIKLKGG